VARKPRIEVPFGYYHAVSRGNNKQEIFDDWVRARFLFRLARVVRRFDWRMFGWAVMSNHFHLVFQLGEGGLKAGMQQLNTGVARDSNYRFGRVNHCFGQRYWSTPLETDEHFRASLRYTLWNPARAGVGAHPGDSKWTSFRGTLGLDLPHEALDAPYLLAHFGSTPDRAQDAFRRFVWAGRERCLAPWDEGRGILR